MRNTTAGAFHLVWFAEVSFALYSQFYSRFIWCVFQLYLTSLVLFCTDVSDNLSRMGHKSINFKKKNTYFSSPILGWARTLGWARLGWAQPSSARLDPAGLGSARAESLAIYRSWSGHDSNQLVSIDLPWSHFGSAYDPQNIFSMRGPFWKRLMPDARHVLLQFCLSIVTFF